MAKRDFYSKPLHQRVGSRVIETLLTYGVVYLLSPGLLTMLAPLQSEINASALNKGQTPPTQGANAVANELITQAPGAPGSS
jgi:hypothetical protein